eukprot:12779802-Alexandrium_andersonii.AAC.1
MVPPGWPFWRPLRRSFVGRQTITKEQVHVRQLQAASSSVKHMLPAVRASASGEPPPPFSRSGSCSALLGAAK